MNFKICLVAGKAAKMLSEKYYKIAVTPKGQPISSERLAEMKLINQRNALSADD